jgi:5-methylcytosine-specific restriction protein A
MNHIKRNCSHAGCFKIAITEKTLCTAHLEAAIQKQKEKVKATRPFRDPNSDAVKHKYMYKTALWKKTSKAWLSTYPTCVLCDGVARNVDHIEWHKGDWSKFLDPSNLRSLCYTCHGQVTAAAMKRERLNGKKYKGGFGDGKEADGYLAFDITKKIEVNSTRGGSKVKNV